MQQTERQTEYRPAPLWVGGLLAAAGFLTSGLAFGLDDRRVLAAGALIWLAGWGLVVAGIRRRPASTSEPSIATGAKLHPALAGYRDLYWGTLAAYGGGIVASELVFILVQVVLAGRLQLAPPVAFGIALSLAAMVGLTTGFLGATNARGISIPELTLGLIYFGMPIPALLTVMHFVPALQMTLGYSLREVVYLAEMLGRPQVGYWLIYILLALALVLGITAGFVVTGTGRADLRAGYELFIARRHVSVFKPLFMIGVFLVLILGVVPPLLIVAVVLSAERAVERTRIRSLGLADPLKATEALHEQKLKEASPTWLMTALSVLGVGVGVMFLIIVLSVMSGFEADLQQKILGANSHAMVLKYVEDFSEYPEVIAKVKKVRGIVGATPFIAGEVMIASDQFPGGSIIKGIDPLTVGEVTDLPKNILPGGSLDYLLHPEEALKRHVSDGSGALDERPAPGRGALARATHDAAKDPDEDADDLVIGKMPPAKAEPVLPGIILGKELAAALRVVVGDRVNVISPLGGETGPYGPMPKSRPFRVVGIYYSGMYEYDSKSSYIRLEEAQKFFAPAVKGATGIELKVDNVDDARRIAKAVYNELDGYPYRTKDWGEMNHNLFAALRTEKLVMGIILTSIVIVAAGLIIATMIMLVLEKRKEISVLKALGVPDGGVVKIFLAEGLQIGVAGGLLGLLAGLALCLFIEKIGLRLDPEVYYIPSLPVKIEPLQTAIVVVIAVLVTWLASIFPALKASRVEPVEGLKAE